MAGKAQRRPVVLGAVGLAVAAALLWASSRITWVNFRTEDGLGLPKSDRLIGSDWAGALTPLALVLLAGIAAIFAVRGWALRIVAVLIAIVAAGSAYLAIDYLTTATLRERTAAVHEVAARIVVSADRSPLGSVLVLLGAVVALTAAISLLRAARTVAGLSDRYQAPAARKSAAAASTAVAPPVAPAADASDDESPVSQRELWDALDAGHDPTASDGDHR